MSDLYWLNDEQMAKLEPFFPKSHGNPRVDDRRVLSGIIFINRNGLRWRDAPEAYGPHKTLCSRWKRWSEKGIFAQMLLELADRGGTTDTLMIDATHLKTHRTASSLGLKKGGRGRLIGRTKGGMNSKLHTVTDAQGRPLRMFLTAGQRSDYIGARALLDGLPPARHMLADRGYDADWYREALENMGITPCIPARKGRKVQIRHDEVRYRKRHKIENSFARLKDWRRVATRYDRCPKVFLSACALPAVVMFWL
ncbi:IS5 family transposase [Pseudooceanicola spongiae]|uniref:IS5 family transposase n=1 Tax=Pseudooceanicola spongiae TaxID=2613965 RepID=A0A7L9WI34_9RHOB|nr:IS5 family transposase [Pseudooceanicola spongiae]QOL80061.1 IS5 family transposase [Pseudooceanicola spongiae]